MSALFLILCVFVSKSSIIIVFIVISSFFNGAVRPSTNAMIIDILPPDKRKLGLSLQYLGINLGAALGPLVAGFLFNNWLSIMFIGDAITSFIAVMLVILYIEETNPIHIKKTVDIAEKESRSMLQYFTEKPLIGFFLIINIIYSIVYTQCKFYLPLMLNELYGKDGIKLFGSLMSVNAFTVIIFTMLIVSLTKNMNMLKNIVCYCQ